MKRIIIKSISVFLAVILTAFVGSVGVFALTEESVNSDNTYYKGTYYYRPSTGEYSDSGDNADCYVYSDDYFKKSGRAYDPHLSTMSYVLALTSINSGREATDEEGYRHMNRNLTALLEDIGFSDIVFNEDYLIKPTKVTIGVACAHKRIVQDGKDYTLLAVVPRSAGYEAEWGDNFVLGSEGNAQGFNTCAEKCLSFAKNYISEREISGDIKVWTVGYSRGAAVVNLMAAKLIDDPRGYLGDAATLDSDNLYAYTCAAPLSVDAGNDPHNEKYAGIFNSYLDTEIVSVLAPGDMGFERYGTQHVLYQKEKYDEMLNNLSVINDNVHDTYCTSINSNLFHPKKPAIVDGSLGTVNDNDSYIPSDVTEYLNGMCTYLTSITGGREEYVRTYEQPLSDLFAYIMSRSDAESSAMISAFTESDDTIYAAVALYAYFMRTKSKSKIACTEAQLMEKTSEIAAVAAGDEEYTDTGISAGTLAKAAARLGVYLLMDADRVKEIAADYLSCILKEAMASSGATQDEIDAVTNDDSCLALTHLLSHLVFGNIWQNDEINPLSFNNQQIKSAATLIGNASNLFVDHLNEIVISWLKTEDSYYSDFGPFEGSQLFGYRRVYFRTDGADINGCIVNSDGNPIAEIENGIIKNSTDRWIGFTATDDGGFFRIPADRDYQIRFGVGKTDSLSVIVGEYDVYDAKTTIRFDETVSVNDSCVAEITLPSLEESYSMPSDTVYSVNVNDGIRGDIDLNGEVEIVDATLLQRHLSKTIVLSDTQLKHADADSDGTVDVLDVTAVQRYLIGLKAPDGIGMLIK